MADHNQTVTLTVEARDEFRALPISDPSKDRYCDPESFQLHGGWHGTYENAHDQGMTMLAKADSLIGFTIEKRVVRA